MQNAGCANVISEEKVNSVANVASQVAISLLNEEFKSNGLISKFVSEQSISAFKKDMVRLLQHYVERSPAETDLLVFDTQSNSASDMICRAVETMQRETNHNLNILKRSQAVVESHVRSLRSQYHDISDHVKYSASVLQTMTPEYYEETPQVVGSKRKTCETNGSQAVLDPVGKRLFSGPDSEGAEDVKNIKSSESKGVPKVPLETITFFHENRQMNASEITKVNVLDLIEKNIVVEREGRPWKYEEQFSSLYIGTNMIPFVRCKGCGRFWHYERSKGSRSVATHNGKCQEFVSSQVLSQTVAE